MIGESTVEPSGSGNLPVGPSSLSELQESLKLPDRWCDQSPSPLTSIVLCKISSRASSSEQPLFVTHCLSVSDSMRWSLFVHNREVNPSNCSALASIPSQLTVHSFLYLHSLVDRLTICVGQPDSHFIAMVTSKKGILKSRDGSAKAKLDDYAPVLNGEVFTQTIRTVKCELLLDGNVDLARPTGQLCELYTTAGHIVLRIASVMCLVMQM